MQSARGLLTQMHVKNLLNKNYAELQYTSTVHIPVIPRKRRGQTYQCNCSHPPDGPIVVVPI